MGITKKHVVYSFNSVMDSDKHKALQEVRLGANNHFDTESEAIQALIDHDKTFENYVILKQIYITTY